ncbi:multicomponent Na+:H+ antiporter subunit F [Rhodoligotrophos appendicifer]|uniref:cation:proton antiporter n=1 Tax=Rhodoligotrophos appendicifer TaxID=987056 RepID=UPI001185A5CA|nr:cation:proton antiporter [Rhodoligotrophos appendicifer]
MTGAVILSYATNLALIALLAAFALTIFRLIKGPSLPDRIVALDLLTVIAVGVILVLAVTRQTSAFVDVALALGLVAFLATVAFARYVISRGLDRAGGSVETDENQSAPRAKGATHD